MNKKLNIRVLRNCNGTLYWFELFLGNRRLRVTSQKSYDSEKYTYTLAERLSKRTGIPFNRKLYKTRGC